MIQADHLYACDPKWWRHHADRVLKEFTGQCWTQQQRGGKDPDEAKVIAKYGLQFKYGLSLPGLGREDLHYGQNSGYQAINLAYLLGAKRIVLLGYDMQQTGGKRHYFGDHPDALHCNSPYQDWIGNFDALASDLSDSGVSVINCTRRTALKCFPQMTINEIRS